MSDGNFSASSFADTAQWKLIIGVSETGLCAFLKSISDNEAKPVMLVNKKWEKNAAGILENIESAVFDTPRMLDDFATQIIVSTDKSLWIPTDITDDDEFDENLFTSVYPAEIEDLFSDMGEDQVCLYTLIPGLNSFFRRTLPGCKISSHISLLKNTFQKVAGNSSVFVNVHEKMVDIITFRDGEFLCGVTHQWREPSDIAYKIMLAANVYSLDLKDTEIQFTGDNQSFETVVSLLSEFFKSINRLDIPQVCKDLDVPLSVALAAGYNIY